ncbi:MAG: class I SAM-dependent DNA methyltransferase, partial [Candidatus Kapabacteria bacterium]|nr:class I SAM-dependent DNA methyltransferase [Candidatus Kapabacteria bacterium]
WGKISPAIFGSLFQSVLDPTQRRNLGAHYTSEKNILKVIKPLFLDELYQEFEQIKSNKKKVEAFHDKLSKLKFLDPACGCGNFLIIAYRELRLLEIEVVKKQLGKQLVNVNEYLKVDVDQFYGIEIDEFPSQIAQVAMWLTDHQMNMRASDDFGEYYIRLPLTKSATIVNANALRMDWKQVVPNADFIFGNPPFIGKNYQNAEQRNDMAMVMANLNGGMLLDYVTAWYVKSAQYLQDLPQSACAFVSTNSITQGEQVGILWNDLFNKYKVSIRFAHRTFRWSNEARGVAAVHVIVIGFGTKEILNKRLFFYDEISNEPHELVVRNISPYLTEGSNIIATARTLPLVSSSPKMVNGNKPTDGGNLLLSADERLELIRECPQSEPWIKPFAMGDEFINGIERYCLWLVDCPPSELRTMPAVLRRVEKVQKMRSESSDKQTQIASRRASQFQAIRQTKGMSYLAIPRVSSERRDYIPMAFLTDTIAGDKLQLVENATNYHFGVLTSLMHMAWMKVTSGRLESRYQYSAKLTFNTFPWPETVNDKQREQVEKCAQAVLDARVKYPTSSLADLYDPLTMPPDLVKAHNALDKAVDLCYRKDPFPTESQRIAYLFELYEKYTANLFTEEKPKKKKRK